MKEVDVALDNFIRLLHAVVHGASLREEAEKSFVSYVGSGAENLLVKFDKMVEE